MAYEKSYAFLHVILFYIRIRKRNDVAPGMQCFSEYSTLTDGEYMLTKTVLDPKEDGTYDQATMYVTFVFGTP